MGKADPVICDLGSITTLQGAKASISRVEHRIAECKRFYPWPALVASFEKSLLELRALEAQLSKSNDLANDSGLTNDLSSRLE